MTKIFVLRRSTLILVGILLVAAVIGTFYVRSLLGDEAVPVAATTAEYHIAIVEYEGSTKDGKAYEIYRFDPGTIYVQHGQRVTLTFHGLHGAHHSIIIDGYNIQDHVSKGEATSVTFTANKKGTFRILCETHDETSNLVPMVGYLVVG